ncbi:MAG: type II toxin-antitoxin system VapC family toxin [Chloroflexi bacterium]|nr:type II toxin-antitoxin system VapC family toxin [Chloroflexota bacterium]
MQQLSSNEIVAETVPLTRAMMDQATAIRAQYGFKTPDAIHLACAITAKCDLFLTNDKQLQKQNEIAIKLVED